MTAELEVTPEKLRPPTLTATMYASSTGSAEVVEQLLAAGADPRHETIDGFSALDMASTLECLRLLRRASKKQRPDGVPPC